ncbi:MAG: DUF86 domain-containing protein [Burkholderiales bacterium]
MTERDALRLRHILDAAQRIAGYLKGADQSTFLSNPMMQDAVIRNLEVIGEACANLSPELMQANASIPWSKASAIRNRLVHGYFDVDLRVVWQTGTDSIPAFARQIGAVLDAGR